MKASELSPWPLHLHPEFIIKERTVLYDLDDMPQPPKP